MASREQVLDALKSISDHSHNRSLLELGLIKDIMLKEASVHLTIITTDENEDKKNLYHRQVEEALSGLQFQEVHVRFRPITETERGQLDQKLQECQSGSPAPRTEARSASQAASAPLLASDSGTTFIAVASGKGGVGKSTVTVNLAVALARQGKRVGIIDADIYGFSVPDMMGIEDRPQKIDERIVPVERYGVKVISMGFFVEDNAPIIWRGPMLGKMLRSFFTEFDWGQLDYMVLDLPPGTGDMALDVHQLIPESKEIVVTTPHPTAAFVAARAGSMALRTDHEIIGVIENMSYYVDKSGDKAYLFGRGGGIKLAEELNAELLAQIPLGAPDNDPAEPDYSPSVYKPDTDTGRIYDNVARRIISKLE